jgi:hypothetical protein
MFIRRHSSMKSTNRSLSFIFEVSVAAMSSAGNFTSPRGLVGEDGYPAECDLLKPYPAK